MSKTRIYKVIEKESGKIVALVDAKSDRAAIDHHCARPFNAEVATPMDVAMAMRDGIDVDTADAIPL